MPLKKTYINCTAIFYLLWYMLVWLIQQLHWKVLFQTNVLKTSKLIQFVTISQFLQPLKDTMISNICYICKDTKKHNSSGSFHDSLHAL